MNLSRRDLAAAAGCLLSGQRSLPGRCWPILQPSQPFRRFPLRNSNGSLIVSVFQRPPVPFWRGEQRPAQGFPDRAIRVEYLITEGRLVDRSLNAVQIYYAF